MQKLSYVFFFFQAEDGIRDADVTGDQTCALPISPRTRRASRTHRRWTSRTSPTPTRRLRRRPDKSPRSQPNRMSRSRLSLPLPPAFRPRLTEETAPAPTGPPKRQPGASSDPPALGGATGAPSGL